MDQSEQEDIVECIDCGASISPGVDRAYAVTTDAWLCFECAERRGGVYDSDEDRWVTAPNVADLPQERIGISELDRMRLRHVRLRS